jgi:hypothetical protein
MGILIWITLGWLTSWSAEKTLFHPRYKLREAVILRQADDLIGIVDDGRRGKILK